jgi:hypothetical protein
MQQTHIEGELPLTDRTNLKNPIIHLEPLKNYENILEQSVEGSV